MGRPKKEKPNRADGLYEVKITIRKKLDGSLIRKSFYSSTSKEDAKRQAEEYKIAQEVSKQTGVGLIVKDFHFSDWAKKWLEIYKKDNVREYTYQRTYRPIVENYLIPYFGNATLKDIRPADVQAFYNSLSKEYSDSTLKKAKLCLNAILEAAVDNELCIRNPARNVPLATSLIASKEADVLTREEVDVVENFALSHRYGLEILLLLRLGLRRSELLGLKWSDIDEDRRSIHIQRSVTGTGKSITIAPPKTKTSIRELPLDNQLYDILITTPRLCEYIIHTKQGKVIAPDGWNRRHYGAFRKDFLQEHPECRMVSPHKLRHTCGTILYQNTKNIYAVSKFLGHADIGITTKIYVHNDLETLRESLQIDKMSVVE